MRMCRPAARSISAVSCSSRAALTVPRELTSAYIVVREGALLDASGASAEIDYLASNLPEQRRNLLLATDGGRIAFDFQYGVFLDGEMRAHAGGAGALGGELSVALTTPILFDHGATGFPAAPCPISCGACAA